MLKISVEIPKLEDLLKEEQERIVRGVTFNTAITMREKHAAAIGTGFVYQRGGGKTHRASAVGEIPVVDTKSLLYSIGAEMPVGALQGTIRLNDYGWILEEKRPWIMPSLEETLAEFGL